ncbi:MAG: filamentous hemagglutinin N-terminal domain-containing protein, partial [Symploca sp. SIO2C1]|nr:filamentous hemagglutinin N-terminal domain-containing protein [Symploca sp. SIO2C1]
MNLRLTYLSTITLRAYFAIALALPVQAQIMPDDTLPNNSVVTPNGNILTLTGGTVAGTNLFHSFEQFSILTGQTAYFNNDLNIQNILTRVTGGNISTIDGLIQTNGTANLFLINPNGIIFELNAQLNIGGSFTASTADGIKLGDNAFYSATDTANSSLLTIQPGVLFTNASRNHTALLTNEGNLAVAPGQNLTLQGDEVTITGSVTAQGGNLILDSNGNISLTDSMVTNVGVIGNGSIQLKAENISLERSQIISSTSSNQAAPDVTVNAARAITITGVTLPQSNQNPFTLNSRISSETSGVAAGGDITVNAAAITLENGGQISTVVGRQATGNGGKVRVNATDSISATGAYPFSPLLPSGIASYTLGAGRGGEIDVSTSSINLIDGARIFSLVQGTGRGGDIQVKAANSLEATGLNPLAPQFSSGILAQTLAKGDGGTVSLSTRYLRLFEGAKVISSSLNQLIGTPVNGAGEGNAGDVTVNAQQVEVVGVNLLAPENIPGILSVTSGSGNAGNLMLTTDTLSIRDGGVVASSVFQSITSIGQPLPNSATGNGGNVTVKASQSIEIIGSSPLLLFSSRLGTGTSGTGNAGDTIINTPQLRLLDGGIINSATFVSGNAGNLTINAAEIFISGTTPDQFPAGVDGSAVVLNTDIQQAFFVPPELTGRTGKVTINTDKLTIQDRGQIRVRHQGIGNAGSLTIN